MKGALALRPPTMEGRKKKTSQQTSDWGVLSALQFWSFPFGNEASDSIGSHVCLQLQRQGCQIFCYLVTNVFTCLVFPRRRWITPFLSPQNFVGLKEPLSVAVHRLCLKRGIRRSPKREEMSLGRERHVTLRKLVNVVGGASDRSIDWAITVAVGRRNPKRK